MVVLEQHKSTVMSHMQAVCVNSQLPIGHPTTFFHMWHNSPLCVQDVTAKGDGQLIARAFVSTPTLLPLQGSIAAALVSPNLQQVPPLLITIIQASLSLLSLGWTTAKVAVSVHVSVHSSVHAS